MSVTVDEAKLGRVHGADGRLHDRRRLVLFDLAGRRTRPLPGPGRHRAAQRRAAGRPGPAVILAWSANGWTARRPAAWLASTQRSDTYELTAEAAIALADENSPAFVARGMNAFASMFIDKDKITAAFKGDGALGWGEHHPCLFKGTEWFFRTGYRAYLPTEWLPALDGVDAKLQAGAKVADVGCGHGASVVVMAHAYPNSRIWGFDFHAPSIDTARPGPTRRASSIAPPSRSPTRRAMTAVLT